MANKNSRRISNYKRGYPIIDTVCGYALFGGIVFGMFSMISYANQRDFKALSQQQPMAIRIDK